MSELRTSVRNKGQSGVDAVDDEFIQRAAQAHQRLVAGAALHDQLADQRIVIGRDHIALIDGGIDAHADAARRMIIKDLARRGPESRGMFGVDAAFDGVAAQLDIGLGVGERRAAGDLDLLDDEIEAGNHLGDRMLDLDAGIHLDEIELAILVEELDGAGAGIAQLAHGGGADFADPVALVLIERRGGGLLQNLLMAALQGAVALADMHGVSPPVAENLDLDMARLFQIFFQIDRVVAEGRLGFGARHGQRLGQVVRACARPSCRVRRRPPPP